MKLTTLYICLFVGGKGKIFYKDQFTSSFLVGYSAWNVVKLKDSSFK